MHAIINILIILSIVLAYYFNGSRAGIAMAVGILLSYGMNTVVNSKFGESLGKSHRSGLLWGLTYASMIMFVLVPILLYLLIGWKITLVFVGFIVGVALTWEIFKPERKLR